MRRLMRRFFSCLAFAGWTVSAAPVQAAVTLREAHAGQLDFAIGREVIS
jgi:hypothetical protein